MPGRTSVSEELFSNTNLPWRVALGYFESGQKDKAVAIVDDLGECDWPEVQAELDSWRNPTMEPDKRGTLLSPERELDPKRFAPVMKMTDKVVTTDLQDAIRFGKGVGNPLWKLDVLRIIGTRVAKQGKGRELIEFVKDLDLESPERTAIYRGFVTGIAWIRTSEPTPPHHNSNALRNSEANRRTEKRCPSI